MRVIIGFLCLILIFMFLATRANYREAEATHRTQMLFNQIAINRSMGIEDPYLEQRLRELLYPR